MRILETINVKILEKDGVAVVEVALGRPIRPGEAADAAKTVDASLSAVLRAEKFKPKGVVVSGRMPTWLYGMILHRIGHEYGFVAFYDPKLDGAVVVSSHLPDVKEGEVVKLGEGDRF